MKPPQPNVKVIKYKAISSYLNSFVWTNKFSCKLEHAQTSEFLTRGKIFSLLIIIAYICIYTIESSVTIFLSYYCKPLVRTDAFINLILFKIRTPI